MACKGLDAQVVRPEDTELARLLNQFVPVRITNFKGVDLNRFQFDYDLTFAALMMDPEGGVYSRFGSRDAGSATARLSIAGLKRSLREVLALYRQGARGDRPVERPAFTTADYAAFARRPQSKQPCYHCHFANNARFSQVRADGRFLKPMLFQYPLPENIGITLDVDRNNVVKAVLPGSPAEKAGLRAEDVLTRADQTRVLSTADLQFALNPLAEPGVVTLQVRRGGMARRPVTLALPAGWRVTDISWRQSIDGIPPQIGFWGEPLKAVETRERGLTTDRMALAVRFLFPAPEWAKTRGDLRLNDVVLGVNDERLPPMNVRQFHAYFRLHFNVGDTVTLNVLRGTERLNIRVPCVEVGEG